MIDKKLKFNLPKGKNNPNNVLFEFTICKLKVKVEDLEEIMNQLINIRNLSDHLTQMLIRQNLK